METIPIKQLEVNPSGVAFMAAIFNPGLDPGYWKSTPTVSFEII